MNPAVNDTPRTDDKLGCSITAMTQHARELERELALVRDAAEVIGNVTAALLDVDVTYFGNQATFTFLSTNDPMRYIHKARRIVEERLALIRAAESTN